MKILEKYYKKIYMHTDKLLKKVFGTGVISSMRKNCELKRDIEKSIQKPIEEITLNDLTEKKLSAKYCEYKTLSEILRVLSGVAFLNSYRNEDIEEIKNENK